MTLVVAGCFGGTPDDGPDSGDGGPLSRADLLAAGETDHVVRGPSLGLPPADQGGLGFIPEIYRGAATGAGPAAALPLDSGPDLWDILADLVDDPCQRPGFDPAALDIFSEFLVSEYNRLALRASALAVTDECGLLYQGTFGSYGANPQRAVSTYDDAIPMDALFRIGSMSKVLGAAALQHLVAHTPLDWEHEVFCLGALNQNPCLFQFPGVVPANTLFWDQGDLGVANPFLSLITVRDIQGHSSGLNVVNPLVTEFTVSNDLDIAGSRDLVATDFVEWILPRPISFLPGSQWQYSNFGHFLVGVLIEEYTDMDYEDYLCMHILSPAGIDCDDIPVANSRPYEWLAREVGHDNCIATAPSPWQQDVAWNVVFGTQTCREKGGLMLKIAETTGGMLSSAPAQAEFLRRYWCPWAGSPHCGLPRTDYWNPPPGATRWNTAAWPNFLPGWDNVYGHNGGLQDAQSDGRQCTTGLNIVIFASLTAATGANTLGGPNTNCQPTTDFVNAAPFVATIYQQNAPGAWWLYHTPAPQYQALFDEQTNAASDRRLHDINGYSFEDSTLYATTWVPDDGTPWRATHGLELIPFETLVADWRSDGFRPVKVSAFDDHTGTLRFAAVFEATPSGTFWDADFRLTASQLEAMHDLKQTGRLTMNIIALDGYRVANGALFAAVWTSDAPFALFRVDELAADVVNDLTGEVALGRDIFDLDIYSVPAGIRYATIFQDGVAGPRDATLGLGHYQQGLTLEQQSLGGWVPISVSAERPIT